jgi:hypothetical protein
LFSGKTGDFRKSGWIRNGQVSQDLSIQLNAGQFQPVHEFAVRQIVYTCCGIDSCNPESSEITLSDPAIPVGVHQGFVQRIRSRAKQFAASGAISPG